MSKKKLLTSITAVALAATMVLGGTFAWQSINQTVVNEGSNIVNPGGRLHDDFDGSNKDVYVENFASQPIYTRIRLEEYFKVAVNTGHGNKVSSDVIGEAVKDGEGNVTGYDYRIFKDYDRLREDNTIPACWEIEGGEPTTSYFKWTMGSADSATAYYMPTFNLNKDSLVADINGYYNQGLGVISGKDVAGGQYDDYTAYNADSTENGTEIYDADENTADEVGSDFSAENLAAKVTAGNIKIKENITHNAAEIGSTKGLISMEAWLTLLGEEDYDADTHGGYWVYDTDGWVYWSGAIAANQTTGRLLDSIEMTERMDDGWYYALNVVAQFITAGDMGQKEGNTGFYDATSGTAPTENALKLLAAIGVNTTDAKSAEELSTKTLRLTANISDFGKSNVVSIALGIEESVKLLDVDGQPLEGSFKAFANTDDIADKFTYENSTLSFSEEQVSAWQESECYSEYGTLLMVEDSEQNGMGLLIVGDDGKLVLSSNSDHVDATTVRLGQALNLQWVDDGSNATDTITLTMVGGSKPDSGFTYTKTGDKTATLTITDESFENQVLYVGNGGECKGLLVVLPADGGDSSTGDADSGKKEDEAIFTVTADGTALLGITDSLTYSGTAAEFVFDFDGPVSDWTFDFHAPDDYVSEEVDGATVIYELTGGVKGDKIATWDGTSKLTMMPGKTLENCDLGVVYDGGNYSLKINKIEFIDWSELVTMRNITSEEYDKLLSAAKDGDDSIMHWSTMGSITDTVATTYRVIRGNGSASKTAQLLPSNRYENAGLRPAFAALTPDTDCASLSVGNVVVIGTLYVGSDSVKVPTNPVKGGDITNYDKDGSGVTSKITLSTALEDTAYHMKAVYVGDGLFVCDRVMLNYINWNQISAALAD